MFCLYYIYTLYICTCSHIPIAKKINLRNDLLCSVILHSICHLTVNWRLFLFNFDYGKAMEKCLFLI